MRTKHAAIRMSLVDNDIFQVCQKSAPILMIWKNADVQHVRVGQDETRVPANGSPFNSWGVAVKGIEVTSSYNVRRKQFFDMLFLVLSQGFGRSQIQCGGFGIGQQNLKNWNVIGQTLPGCCGRGNKDILSPDGGVDG